MDLALYHPEHGYYADPARRRVGGEGDYLTNISVGDAFGRLMARRIHAAWMRNGRPAPFSLLEPGPEDGSFALDFLAETQRIDPAFHAACHYVACEPAPAMAARLRRRLSSANHSRHAVVSSPDEYRAPVGAVIANEVLDALPVRLVRFVDGRWIERRVTVDAKARLVWADSPIANPALARECRRLGAPFPDGYQTELCLRHEPFLASLAACFDRALFTFADYGFRRDDYYHPDRTEGTLRTYSRHRAGDDPLDAPGRQDLTAHVDFSRLTDAAAASGLAPAGHWRQETYLTGIAAPLFESGESSFATPSFISQFRTLTHPALFGARFHVLEFTKDTFDPALANNRPS